MKLKNLPRLTFVYLPLVMVFALLTSSCNDKTLGEPGDTVIDMPVTGVEEPASFHVLTEEEEAQLLKETGLYIEGLDDSNRLFGNWADDPNGTIYGRLECKAGGKRAIYALGSTQIGLGCKLEDGSIEPGGKIEAIRSRP